MESPLRPDLDSPPSRPDALRRKLVIAGAAAPFAASAVAARRQQEALPLPPPLPLRLWTGIPPGGGGPAGDLVTDKKGAASNVSRPLLMKFSPERGNGAAVLIAAGGGYKRIEMASEALPAAAWLAAQGVTAFVLTYRLPSEGWASGAGCAFQDAQRAIRLIRANAREWGVDAQRVGVLGFSAGGHLLGMASARSAFASYDPLDAVDKESARPDGCALVYPVVTLEPPYDQTSTRKQWVGAHPSAEQSRNGSVQTFVRARCPDMFLVQAEDDDVSDPHNTLILAEACGNAGVPVEMHRYAHGGHGFGMGAPGTEVAQWPGRYADWLRARKFLS